VFCCGTGDCVIASDMLSSLLKCVYIYKSTAGTAIFYDRRSVPFD
jgi:hypothetical protein